MVLVRKTGCESKSELLCLTWIAENGKWKFFALSLVGGDSLGGHSVDG